VGRSGRALLNALEQPHIQQHVQRRVLIGNRTLIAQLGPLDTQLNGKTVVWDNACLISLT
jgi:hypothetical protein